MSYAMSAALQEAVYQCLVDDPAVAWLVGDAVYDALPPGELPDLFVVLGPEVVRDRSDKDGGGAEHRFTVSVMTDEAGFCKAKELAGAVSEALTETDMSLSRGRLVGLWFFRAQARRGGKAGQLRRIDLRFRARVEDDGNGSV